MDVLVVDADPKTVDLVRLDLEHAGYTVRVAYDGRQALNLANLAAKHVRGGMAALGGPPALAGGR